MIFIIMAVLCAYVNTDGPSNLEYNKAQCVRKRTANQKRNDFHF